MRGDRLSYWAISLSKEYRSHLIRPSYNTLPALHRRATKEYEVVNRDNVCVCVHVSVCVCVCGKIIVRRNVRSTLPNPNIVDDDGDGTSRRKSSLMKLNTKFIRRRTIPSRIR